MVSFTSLSVLLLSTLAAVTQAAPLDRRIVPVEKCVTVASGNLRTTNGHTFSFKNNELVFGGSLAVEFQQCTPNFGRYGNSTTDNVSGHIYIPSTKKCLTAKPSSTGPPFTFTQDTCYYSDDSGQIYSSFLKQVDNKIYYIGTTQADHSANFWGDKCGSGAFGVWSNVTSGIAQFECTVLQHTVGLNI